MVAGHKRRLGECLFNELIVYPTCAHPLTHTLSDSQGPRVSPGPCQVLWCVGTGCDVAASSWTVEGPWATCDQCAQVTGKDSAAGISGGAERREQTDRGAQGCGWQSQALPEPGGILISPWDVSSEIYQRWPQFEALDHLWAPQGLLWPCGGRCLGLLPCLWFFPGLGYILQGLWTLAERSQACLGLSPCPPLPRRLLLGALAGRWPWEPHISQALPCPPVSHVSHPTSSSLHLRAQLTQADAISDLAPSQSPGLSQQLLGRNASQTSVDRYRVCFMGEAQDGVLGMLPATMVSHSPHFPITELPWGFGAQGLDL